MKHHQYKSDFQFVKEPIEFTKYTDRDLLQYCLGATLYMPGNKKFQDGIIGKKYPGLTSIVMCFEDAITEEELPEAEDNVLFTLEEISKSLKTGKISYKDIPLLFIRVRNTEQFCEFSEKLESDQARIIAGFVFPKFSSHNGHLYLSTLEKLNDEFSDVLYGMPILEGSEIALKETRLNELLEIKSILDLFKNFIVNIRVGATDISSIFGVRRGINYSIYDILAVRDCLSDILNLLNRDGEGFVLSAPVWEYFLADKAMKFQDSLDESIHGSLIKRQPIVNAAVDGLLREVILDKANGFVGKTIIHPSHLKYVNAIQAVTKEEFEDAGQILESTVGVIKSAMNNKMNEIKPHRNWANRIYSKAMAYGVIEDENDYYKLFS